MKKVIGFISSLVKECAKNEIFARAGELTYRLILCVFPLLIFVMTILGFLNLDISLLVEQLYNSMPRQIIDLFNIFDREVLSQRKLSLMSTSLLFSIFSASSGFMGIIRGINKSYGHADTRGMVRVRLLSIGLVFIFTMAIIVCIATIIFQDNFVKFLTDRFNLPDYATVIFGIIGTILILTFLMVTVMVIYKLSNCVRQRFYNVLPGAIVSVVSWVVVSKCFNIYINNFSRFSIIYGSIGSVIVLLLWMNIMSLVLLIGNEINVLILNGSSFVN